VAFFVSRAIAIFFLLYKGSELASKRVGCGVVLVLGMRAAPVCRAELLLYASLSCMRAAPVCELLLYAVPAEYIQLVWH